MQLPDAPPAPCLPTPELSWGSPVTVMDGLSQGTPPLGPWVVRHWGLLAGPAIAAA